MIASVASDLRTRSRTWETWLQDLIRIPSTFANEEAVVAYVASRISDLDHPVYFVEHDDSVKTLEASTTRRLEGARRSVVCQIKGTGNGRSLVLNAHLDTAPAGAESAWTHSPYSGYIDEQNRLIYGRGAFDDKAGVAILLALVDLLREERPAGDVTFQFVLDDETDGNGSLDCLKAGWTGDAAIIVDGTRPDRAISQHAGQLQFSIAATGKPTSISVAHLAVNAGEMLAELLIELKRLILSFNAGLGEPWNCFPTPFQFIVQDLKCSSDHFIVPDRATAIAHAIFPPPQTLASMRALLDEHVRQFTDRHEHLRITLDWNGFATEPVAMHDEALSYTLQEAAKDTRLAPIDIGPSTGISDMRHFADRGIPCLLYGPGNGKNPHRADENYALDDLPLMVAFYLNFIRRWCGAR